MNILRFRGSMLWTGLLALLWFLPLAEGFAQGADARVSQVRVESSEQIDASTVLLRAQGLVGEVPTHRDLGRVVREIWELGNIEDVRVEAFPSDEGIELVFHVQALPVIARVRYESSRVSPRYRVAVEGGDSERVSLDGAAEFRELKVDEFDDFERRNGVRRGAFLNENNLRRMREAILGFYQENDGFFTEVEYEVVPGASGGVDVVYRVVESPKLHVSVVTIVGNRAFEADEVLPFLETRPHTFLSFLTKDGRFGLDLIQNDLQVLRAFYYEHGHLDVRVHDPVIEISPDREECFVTFRVEEGPVYSVSSVGVSNTFPEPLENVAGLLRLRAGDTFRSSAYREGVERLTRRYRDMGYYSVDVDVETDTDPENHTISLDYTVRLGEIAHIGRIRVVGNESTRDRVVRRELVIHEGDRYSMTAIELSKAYLRQLGIFEEVTIREIGSPDGSNLIDLEIEVSERHSRSLQVGIGFSSVENFLGSAQISENNLFGRGQSLSLDAMFSSIRQLFVLSFVEPRLAGSHVSMQVDLFNRMLAYRDFDRTARGASLNFGYRPFFEHPFWRNLGFFLGYRVEDVYLRNIITTRSLRLFQDGLTSSFTTAVSLDRRDDRYMTTRGYYLAVNNELADEIWGSEFNFDRVRGIARGYVSPRPKCPGANEPGRTFVAGLCRWYSGWVFRGNLEIGYVGATRAENVVPAAERFYPGGPNSVRGFPQFSLGPRVPAASNSEDPFATIGYAYDGGTRELLLNFELEFPIVDSFGLRGVIFADAGNAFAADTPYSFRPDFMSERSNEQVLRTAIGFGFRWQSPMGMLRFEWGYPLQRRSGEQSYVFNFGIGPSF